MLFRFIPLIWCVGYLQIIMSEHLLDRCENLFANRNIYQIFHLKQNATEEESMYWSAEFTLFDHKQLIVSGKLDSQ